MCDEIWTGLGRSGAWLASVDQGVLPDVVCLGKGLGEAFRGFKDGIKGTPDADTTAKQENAAAKSETATPPAK